MLRPATPLTILFLIAFALLLISTISTPIIKGIPLGSYDSCNFGVFGYCTPQNCSSISISYDTSVCSGSSSPSLSPSTRHSLSSILVVHPVAAFFNLVCTILAGAAHFHSPGHSPAYLLWLLILSFPTLLLTLLAFLVDILLFVPYLKWGGWIVLVSTIICLITSILICAMRRTLVSRKARKKRIAENADMSGENYYQQRNEIQMTKDPPMTLAREDNYARADSPPPLGATSTSDSLPKFATFDGQRPGTDDRQPLNPGRDPSVKTSSTTPSRSQTSGSRRPPGIDTGAPLNRSRSGGDGQVSPISPIDNEAQGFGQPPANQRYYGGGPPPVQPQQQRRGPPPPMYGRGGRGGSRGGYPERGGYPPRGYPPPNRAGPPRGGYPQQQRGGYPPRNPARGQHYAGYGAAAGAGMAAGAMMGGRGHPPDYNNPYSQDPYAGHGNPYDEYNQNPYDSYNQPPRPQYANSREQSPYRPQGATSPRTEIHRDPSTLGFSGRRPSPARSANSIPENIAEEDVPPVPPLVPTSAPPIGQAVEMDATSGSPARSPVPDRGATTSPGVVSPINENERQAFPFAAPVELPGHTIDRPSTGSTTGTRPRKSSEGAYYEDVDPRFAQDEPPLPTDAPHFQPGPQQHPAILTPAGHLQPPRIARENSGSSSVYTDTARDIPSGEPLSSSGLNIPPPISAAQGPSTSTIRPSESASQRESVMHQPSLNEAEVGNPGLIQPVGADINRTKSPGAASDASHFTSVSQRGVNPNWNGPPPQGPLPPRHGAMGSGSSHYSERPPMGNAAGVMPQVGRPRGASGAGADLALKENPDYAVPGAAPKGDRLGGQVGAASAAGGGGYGHARKMSVDG